VRAIFYHGVIDRGSRDHYFSRLFADVHEFENEISWLARHWRPMLLAEVAQHMAEGKPLPAKAVHVSFDDGFRNNLLAAEVLERHRVPWTLFVVVDAVLDGYRPWYSRLADAVGVTANVQRPDGSVAELSRAGDKWAFDQEVKAELMAGPAARTDATLDAILRLPGMRATPEESWPYLTPEELRQLHQSGVEIGNHSAHHLNLTRCDDAILEAEVEGSRQRLEGALGAPVRFFAYPDGRYDKRVERAVAAGHDLAMSVWRPGARGSRYAMPRRCGGVGNEAFSAALQQDVRLDDLREWAWSMWPRLPREVRHRVRPRSGLSGG